MNLKVINNKKGSALLWAILFTVILTILLGSVCTATYAYFNYTMYTIRRQQAYFTARSALNAIVEEFSYQDEDSHAVYEHDTYGNIINSDGKIILNYSAVDNSGTLYNASDVIGKNLARQGATAVTTSTINPKVITGGYSTSSASIPLMPTSANEKIEITDFEGLDEKMGSAKATITLNKDDSDMIDVCVTSVYADQTYDITATLGKEAIYFGGIAIKSLVLDNSHFELDSETDLYFYTERTSELLKAAGGVAQTFDTTVTTDTGKSPIKLLNGSTITINGNLVTQGDAKINNNAIIAGKTFGVTATEFSGKTGMLRKIWDKDHYIISNKTIELSESSGQYTTSISNVLNNLTKMTFEYCNNTRAAFESTYHFEGIKLGSLTLVRGFDIEPTFGSPRNLLTGAIDTVIKGTDKVLNTFSSTITGQSTNITPIANLQTDGKIDNLAIDKSFSDASAVQYIQILSLSNSVNELVELLDNKTLSKLYTDTIGNYFKENGYQVKDISYINFTAQTGEGGQTASDNATSPLTYLFVEDNLYVRVKYGQKPANAQSTIGNIVNNIDKAMESLASKWFEITQTGACVVVYLGENSTLELGTGYPKVSSGSEPDFTSANQTYFYVIYGEPSSTVILKGKGASPYNTVPLTLVGSVECENLKIIGDVNIIYTSTNGSQVAKQQIAEYWTVKNYKD